MGGMFGECLSLTTLDVSKWNTSNVTIMVASGIDSAGNEWNSGMFQNCKALTSLDVSNFDTSRVTNMHNMFAWCTNLTSLDISGFKTQNVTDMNSMFEGCLTITSLDVSSFDTSKVTNMGKMFRYCTEITVLDLSNFKTRSVVDMSAVFEYCIHLASLYVPIGTDWNNSTILTESEKMFNNCTSLVGGNGTTYDSTHTDKTYARVDGGTSKPGYFTAKAGSVTPSPATDTSLPYLPDEFAGKPVSALYVAAVSEDGLSGNSAAYFFSDQTFVITYNLVGTGDNLIQEPGGKGTYTVDSGDFTSGTITITPTHNWNKSGNTWKESSEGSGQLTVAGGSFTLKGLTYSKQ